MSLNSCSSKTPILIDDSTVILSAEVLTYEQLDSISKAEEFKYGCYCFPSNWNEPKEFEKEKAFFVKAQIDNNLLADISQSNTFPKKDLLEISSTYLYGKYKNRFKFIGKDGIGICETEKFQGFEIMSISRNRNVDVLLIGPLIEKPREMIIEISDSKNYPDAEPRRLISQ